MGPVSQEARVAGCCPSWRKIHNPRRADWLEGVGSDVPELPRRKTINRIRRAIALINKLEHVCDWYCQGLIYAKKSVFNICSSAALICYDQINISSAAGVRSPIAARDSGGQAGVEMHTNKHTDMRIHIDIHIFLYICIVVPVEELIVWNRSKMVLK